MKELKLNAYAKVNLSLDVLGRRPDGYHEVETVLHTLELHDTVVLRESEGGIRVVCDHRRVPSDEQNLVFRTAQLLREAAGSPRGVEIEIGKRIPPASGLGGGSSDAAVTLLGLAQMWKLRLDHGQLLELAGQVGSDVPFFLVGGAALATGRGERLRYLPTLPTTWVVVVCPDVEVSTAWAYAHLDLSRVSRRPDTRRLVEALRAEEVDAVARELCNVFEPLIFAHHPQVATFKRRLLELGALGASMTGTGPAVYGLFPGEAEARKAAEALREAQEAQVFLTRTFAELER